jgi:predicted dehydrogenase
MRKIRIAVVGCGHIGERHSSLIMQIPQAELAAVCDILPDKAQLASKWGVPFFTDIQELMGKLPDFDVLSIAVPNGLHTLYAAIGLEAGKHVIIEKPMGLSHEACENIISLAEKKNLKIFCVMQNRYSPTSVWLKNIISEKRLGEIYMVQVNCFWNRDHRYYQPASWHGKMGKDGGPLFTQFSHFMDILYWVFGEIVDVNALIFDFNHADSTDYEDSGTITFSFKNGGKGNFHYSTSVWDKNLESSITIIGEKGSVKIGGQYMNQVEFAHIQDYTMPLLAETALPNDYGSYKGSAANHIYLFQNVIDVLQNNDGLAVVAMIENIYQQRLLHFQKKV